jgi:hypothetical protein
LHHKHSTSTAPSFAISAKPLLIKLLSGECILGVVTGRSWSFDTLLSFSVDGENRKRYSVNAITYEAGHAY